MGLSIYYSGKFKQGASLENMIDEVREIAKTYNWQYHVFETSFPESGFDKHYTDKIYGISFSAPECEPVALTFLSNGRMCSVISFLSFANSTNKDFQKYLYMLSTKTQFAGENVHKLIIRILRYISKKYIRNFKLTDEGLYWETGDEKVLGENFKKYTDLMDLVTGTLQNLPLKPGETFEEYFKRLIKIVDKKRRK